MNKEYVLLSDGKVAVSNELGNIEKRDFEDKHFIGEQLVLENKLELIDSKLETLNKDLKFEKHTIYMCKQMMIAIPIAVSIITLGAFSVSAVIGNLQNLSDFVTTGLKVAFNVCSVSSILGGALLVYEQYEKQASKKKIIGLKSAIEVAQVLKLNYERDLAKIKEIRVPQSSLEHKINEPNSLENRNKYAFDAIENDLDAAYENAINARPKRLVLKRRTNNKKD